MKHVKVFPYVESTPFLAHLKVKSVINSYGTYCNKKIGYPNDSTVNLNIILLEVT